jgi:2-isopropylmalate synthase
MIFKQHPYLNLYTDIETKQLNEMSRLVSDSMGMIGCQAIVRRLNICIDGIHQDGVKK